jgi:hypothetical protein
MRSAISSSARSSVPNNRRPRGFIARHLTLLSVLLVLCAGSLAINIGSLSTSAGGRNTARAVKGTQPRSLAEQKKSTKSPCPTITPRCTPWVSRSNSRNAGMLLVSGRSRAATKKLRTGNWQQTLNDNRDAFMKDFVTRAEFTGRYPTTDTPTQYVDKLYQHAGLSPATPAERQAAIDEFAGAGTAAEPGARGRALFDVTQNPAFQEREANPSSVQMEYFGYLRRNPNDAPDGNFAGFNFWLSKLNADGGDYIKAQMVRSFIISSEYRGRFGQ